MRRRLFGQPVSLSESPLTQRLDFDRIGFDCRLACTKPFVASATTPVVGKSDRMASFVPLDKLRAISIVTPAIWRMSFGVRASNLSTFGPYLINYFSVAMLSIGNILWRSEIYSLINVFWKVAHYVSLPRIVFASVATSALLPHSNCYYTNLKLGHYQI